MPTDPDSPVNRLRRLLTAVVPSNPFYTRKYAECGLSADNLHLLDSPSDLPFTCKAEFLSDQLANPPYGTNLTYPLERYTRHHQTSGTTTGRPLRWLDTTDSWNAWHEIWRAYFTDFLRITPADRLLFPFSFGPFLGFWTAFEAAVRLGHMVLPAGGMPTTTRLRYLLDHQATILFATPTYALHLAEVAASEGIDLPACPIRAIVVAGEPGGAIPETRQRMEQAWGARVFDHYGLTEVGPAATEAEDEPGHLYIHQQTFLAEVVQPDSDRTVLPGEEGELVLTNLTRLGSPAIRYRTGDVVQLAEKQNRPGWLKLDGGIRGRTDDMIHIRGNNLYPAAIEGLIRRFEEIMEYRVVVEQTGPLANVKIEIETTRPPEDPRLPDRLEKAIRDVLLFRAEIVAVPPGTLPRFEMKAKRVVKK